MSKNNFLVCIICVAFLAWGLLSGLTIIQLQHDLTECQIELEQYEAAVEKDMNDAYLCKLATYYGGDAAQRAYNMRVALNIANEDVPVQEVVLKQLYEVEGLNSYEFEGINYIQTENFDALALIYQYNVDTTKNSTKFIKWN